MKTKLTFLVALPLLSSLACGGKSDAEKFADDFCAEVSKCCGQQGLPSDGKTCRMLMSMGQGYNASAGEACLSEVRAQVSAGTFCQNTTSDQSPCSSVYSGSSSNATGNKKPGDSCTTENECAKSSEGQVVCTGTSLDDRVCQVRVAGKAGEACVGTQEGDTYYGNGGDDISSRVTVCNVSDGLRCSKSTCVALTAVGGSCSVDNDCVRSAYCDGSLCATKISNGGACADTNDCVAGSYCNSSKKCTSQLANGATCSASEMCLSWYCDDTVCTDLGSAIGAGFGLKLLCSEF